MAYYQEDEDPLDPTAPQQNQTAPESGVISGQGSTPAPASTSSAPAPAPTPDNPGNFVGIQQYLAQNKPQAAKLGDTVGNYVTAQGADASNALAQGQSQFNQDVDSNTVKLDQNLFDQAKKAPDQVDADADKKAEFQKERDAQYTGPSSFEETDYYQPINMQIQNALGTANNTQTATGRSQLLTDVAKQNKQQISRGASNLDSALLSVSPDSKTTLANARNSVLPLQDQLTEASQADTQKATDAAAQTAATQKAIQDAFSGSTGVQGQLESGLQTKAVNAQTAATAQQKAIIEALGAGTPLTDDQLKILGITKNQYDGLINDQKYYSQLGKQTPLSDLTKFATSQSAENLINAQNIATPEDYAQYAALNDLMGTNNSFLKDPTQAGKANSDLVDFNYDSTPNALADRVRNLSIPGLNSQYKPSSFNDLNNQFNLNLNPSGAAHQAITIAQNTNQLRSNPNNSTLTQQSALYANQLKSMQDLLTSINGAYDSNLSLPKAYLDRAKQAVKDNLQSEYSKWPSPNKIMPDDDAINQAALTSAYATFLNDLSNDPSKVRQSINTTLNRGQL